MFISIKTQQSPSNLIPFNRYRRDDVPCTCTLTSKEKWGRGRQPKGSTAAKKKKSEDIGIQKLVSKERNKDPVLATKKENLSATIATRQAFAEPHPSNQRGRAALPSSQGLRRQPPPPP
jgi:hypothetical protein